MDQIDLFPDWEGDAEIIRCWMKYVENSISPKKNQQTDALACVYEVVVPTRRNLYFSQSFLNEFK